MKYSAHLWLFTKCSATADLLFAFINLLELFSISAKFKSLLMHAGIWSLTFFFLLSNCKTDIAIVAIAFVLVGDYAFIKFKYMVFAFRCQHRTFEYSIHLNRFQIFNLERFRIIKRCYNVFDFVKMKALCILNRKPTVCRKK